MKRMLKIGLLLLVISVVLIGVSFASQIWYGNLRDYYPYGLEVKAERLVTAPSTYTVLSKDTYIEKAIINGNWTWVQQDDSTSEFMLQGMPEYIFWAPDNHYYFIHQRFSDGIPESWKLMPKPTTTAALLTIPWAGLFIIIGIQRKRKS